MPDSSMKKLRYPGKGFSLCFFKKIEMDLTTTENISY